jgi:arylsulfatase A-like enzyme
VNEIVEKDRPNIVMIMCADLGYGDTGLVGHRFRDLSLSG